MEKKKTESALGAALKALRKPEKKTIRVCDKCGVPLIWTLIPAKGVSN